jgi:hypothetical protein
MFTFQIGQHTQSEYLYLLISIVFFVVIVLMIPSMQRDLDRSKQRASMDKPCKKVSSDTTDEYR